MQSGVEVRSYSQTFLLRRINTYLRQFGRPQLSEKGYCHGLVLLWLLKMSENKEHEFYAVIKKIINKPFPQIKELDDDIEVQKFIAQIEYAQNAYKYSNFDYQHVAMIMDAKECLYSKNYYSLKKFAELLDSSLHDRQGMAVVGPTECMHSVGIFLRDNTYYFFDANYDEGEAHLFNTSSRTAIEMGWCLHDNFGVKRPQWMSLEFSIVDAKPVKQKETSVTDVSLFPKQISAEATTRQKTTDNNRCII